MLGKMQKCIPSVCAAASKPELSERRSGWRAFGCVGGGDALKTNRCRSDPLGVRAKSLRFEGFFRSEIALDYGLRKATRTLKVLGWKQGCQFGTQGAL